MKFPYFVGGFSVLLVVVYGVVLILNLYPKDVLTLADAGTFGDSFGVLTSLFSALAFLGVVWTLHYQREESRLQKEELSENRKEMAKQGFENSFFQMIRLHNEIVNGFSLRVGAINNIQVKEGRVVFDDLDKQLRRLFDNRGLSLDSPEEEISEFFDIFYERHKHMLAHYFRFLYNIYKFIHESDVGDKYFYAKLVRAQLSNQELFILYYNALNKRGEKFKKYMIDFQLMDNLSSGELFFPEHRELIPGAGFKS
ncbi:putative phage abortive infection protein [Cedecea sp. NFIX57]|uniref:putative phage abortive infection protein n=1 Tax=Cedecea sp. NFIX57 TaxID=1566286 RepID=UPI000A0CD5AC|nr:putative phage abortive infection protein [Cedecea sp. NFIX57]SMG61422.1 Putative phage abortive infection protein [Cedecea sp. NFIX57]